jgi:hypothetical protein
MIQAQYGRRPHTRSDRYYLALFGVIGAHMGFKFHVALQLEVAHHFIMKWSQVRQCQTIGEFHFGSRHPARTSS